MHELNGFIFFNKCFRGNKKRKKKYVNEIKTGSYS